VFTTTGASDDCICFQIKNIICGRGGDTDVSGRMRDIRSISIRRADLVGYLMSLVGLMLIIDSVWTAFVSGVALGSIGEMTVGLSAIAGSIYGYFRPDEMPDGTEPAPLYLYVLASIATVAFVFWMFVR
jgi:hypothetical protein